MPKQRPNSYPKSQYFATTRWYPFPPPTNNEDGMQGSLNFIMESKIATSSIFCEFLLGSVGIMSIPP